MWLLLVSATVLCPQPQCPENARGNGECDIGCMTEACGFDSHDCESACSLHCDLVKLGNGSCDSDCDTAECGWDSGDCGVCASGCTESLLDNASCDQPCNSLSCLLDAGMCVSEGHTDLLYVWTGDFPLERTLYPWVRSVAEAVGSAWAEFTTIYLLKGSHVFENSLEVSAGTVTITTLLCADSSSSECSESPVTLQLTARGLSVAVSAQLRLIGVHIRGLFALKPGCTSEACFYCPVLSTDVAGTTRDDRGAILTEFAEQSLCDAFSQSSLFVVKPQGILLLRDVSFASIWHQPKSLIESECGNVTLLHVNFTDITPAFTLGSVLSFTGGFLQYLDGEVNLLNSRYQLSEGRAFRGFISAQSLTLFSLVSVRFSLNAVWNGALISIAHTNILNISNCKFENNAVDTLIVANASQTLFRNNTVESNFLRRGVQVGAGEVEVSDCAFTCNVCEVLLWASAADQQASFRFTHSTLTGNLAGVLLSLQALALAVIEQSTFDSNGNQSALRMPLEAFVMSPESAVTLMPDVRKPNCSAQVSIEAADVTLSQLAMRLSTCVSSSFFVSGARNLQIAELLFAGNDGPGLLSLRVDVAVVLSGLTFTDNSNEHSQASVCLTIHPAPIDLIIANSTFMRNRGRFRTVASLRGLRSVVLTNVSLVGNIASSAASGFAFTPAGVSSLTISRCTFTANEAYSQGPVVLSNEDIEKSTAPVTLSISESTFERNSARLAGASVTLVSVVLGSESALRKCVFANNSCEEGGCGVFLDASAGRLLVADSVFRNNQGGEGVAVFYKYDGLLASSFLMLTRSVFLANKGGSAVRVIGLRFPSLSSEECRFENNTASAVAIASGSWTDRSSSFVRNSARDGPVLVLASALATLRGCLATENSASVRGGAFLVSASAVLKCENCTFLRNACLGLGGVLYISENSTLQFTNVTFSRNWAKSHGAVMYVHASTVVFNDTRFTGNEAAGFGTLVIYESTFSVENSEFRDNTATAKSPGIVTRFSTGAISTTLFQNQTGKTGAFLFATDLTTVTISKSVFRSCSANSGGAFVILVVTTLNVKDSIVSECSSATDGGVLSCRICTIQLVGVTIRNIKSPESTGAFFFLQSTLTVSHSTFSQLSGSAVYAEGTTVTIDSSTFSAIRTIYGGAVNCVDCLSLNVSKSDFFNNVAKKGGALYSFTTGASAASRLSFFSQNTFTGNRAVNGGAVYSESVFVRMEANSFVANSARSSNYASEGLTERGFGGAVYAVCSFLAYCGFEYTRNVFLNNSAETQGGALRWANSYPTLRENTMSENSALYGSDIAAFAVRLALMADNGTILSAVDFEDLPVLAELEAVASGQLYEGLIRVALLDQYGSIVRIDSSSSAHMKTDNTSKVNVYGNIQVAADRGIFEFSNFTVSGPPNSTQSLFISTDGVNLQMKAFTGDPSEYFATVKVRLKFRACVLGESFQFEECKPCPVNTFSLAPSEPCASCPAHVICHGTYLMVPDRGYWRPDPYRNLFFECPNSAACLGSSDPKNFSLTGECAVGYTSNLCSTCLKGFSKQTSDFCAQCPSLGTNIAFTTVLLVFILAVLCLLVIISIRSASRPRSEFATYMKIFMNYLQMVVVSGSVKLHWPSMVSAFLKMQTMAANASDQLLSFDCLFEEFSTQEVYFTNVAAYVVLPAALFALSLLCWLALKHLLRITHVLHKMVATLVMVLFILHTSLTKTLFSVFSCVELLPGEFWLAADLSIRCWNAKHTQQVLLLAVPGICVWVLGLPTLCLLMLVHSRKMLQSESTKLRFSFLYKGYRNDFFFWEFVILYRKVLLVCASVFLTLLSRMFQALSVLAVLLLSVFLQLYIAPYNLASFNSLEAKSILASLVTIYTGLFFETRTTPSQLDVALFVVLLLTNVYFVLAWARLVLPLLLITFRNWLTAVRRKRVEPTRTFVKQESLSHGNSKSDEYTQSRVTPYITAEAYIAPASSFVEAEDSLNDGSRITFRNSNALQ